MTSARPITVRGRPLADGRLPAICAPLVARDAASLAEETARVAALQPDLLEWRVDFLADLADPAAVLQAGRAVRAAAAGLPILFTRRSRREGGQPIGLAEAEVLDRYQAVCEAGLVDLIDTEMDNDPADVARLRALADRCGVTLVLSFHDFQRTPSVEAMVDKFRRAQELGADVAKLAVMPQSMEDVHALLGATLQAQRALRVPVISMAMGGLGAVSRLCGGLFGSALTFAVGAQASAPGQMPIEEVRAGIEILRRAAG